MCACDAGAPRGGPRPEQLAQNEIAKAQQRAQAELDAVARAVLERYLAQPDSLPDHGLVDGNPLYMSSGMGFICPPEGGECVDDPRAFTAAALPSPTFNLRSRAELQDQATTTDTFVKFIFIYGLHIEGPEASLFLGVGDLTPDPKQHANCCCSEEQIWVKRERWIYARTTSSQCN